MNVELIQAAQQALSALEKSQPHPSNPVIGLTNQDFINHEKTIRQLRAAIQQAEAKVNEPVNPTHWRAVLSEPQRPHELRKHLHIVLFREWDDAESWVASKLDFEGWQYTLEPLYTRPAPGVPDNTACKSVQKRLEAQQSATASACNIPGMAKTTCPYCEQGFSFEYT